MIELNEAPAPQQAPVAAPAQPRDAAWRDYQSRLHLAVCLGQASLADIRSIIEQGGTVDELVQHLGTFEVAVHHMAAAAQGLGAVSSSAGVA
ncbi:hypothetical protein [Methylobacterium organophilum]|uniref:Uncharacterized protein n=1 Tax=Methylobacterium organophilum TaxID=410 RepID=A0ABQ4THQ4_METOR|nr:hypothetical protein [Methylobacterium organophilum]GJE29557.1 hypothetical protein LKMONMHP_4439 [Methylobacterium organophilum]